MFVLRRLATGVVLVVAISVATFFLLFATAGDVARNILGGQASAASVAQLRHQLGLDQPVTTQFWHWAGRAVQGDLGESYAGGQPVAQILSTRLPVTLSLMIGATLVTAVVAVILGVTAARRGGRVDGIVQVGAVLGAAVPGFLVAIGLVLTFAIGLNLVKPTGYTAFTDSPVQWLSSIILPVVGLSLSSVAGVVLQVRGAVIDALHQDYVRTLRSRGLSKAFAGADAVVSCIGVPLRAKKPIDLMRRTLPVITRATRNAGIQRFVLVSAFGVGDTARKGSFLARLVYRTVVAPIFKDKELAEEILPSTGLNWTTVYPVNLKDAPAAPSAAVKRLDQVAKVPGLPTLPFANAATALLDIVTTEDPSEQRLLITTETGWKASHHAR
ncbi:NAD(P)H-binding protein [Streptomyces sp. NPDC005921]